MWIALVAGVLLLFSGVSGVATWNTIRGFVSMYIVNSLIVQIIFSILLFFASLGGISVIIGGLLIGKDKRRTGKILLSLGAGLGLIGLLFSMIVAFVESNLALGSFFSIGTVGILLSIVARISVK
jgi:hypothetical protein